MEDHSAMIAALIGAAIGSIAGTLDHIFSFVAVVTAAFAGTARYIAVLRGLDKAKVERLTAYGFVVGAVLSALILVLDRLIGG